MNGIRLILHQAGHHRRHQYPLIAAEIHNHHIQGVAILPGQRRCAGRATTDPLSHEQIQLIRVIANIWHRAIQGHGVRIEACSLFRS